MIRRAVVARGMLPLNLKRLARLSKKYPLLAVFLSRVIVLGTKRFHKPRRPVRFRHPLLCL